MTRGEFRRRVRMIVDAIDFDEYDEQELEAAQVTRLEIELMYLIAKVRRDLWGAIGSPRG